MQEAGPRAVGEQDHVESVIVLARAVAVLSLHCVLDAPRQLAGSHVSAAHIFVHLICSTCGGQERYSVWHAF